MTKSAHNCPVCGQPLRIKENGNRDLYGLILYCGNGPCPSKAANRGAIAGSEDGAYEELQRLVNAEEAGKV